MDTNIEKFFLPGEGTDLGYINIRDRPHHEETRQFINLLWDQYSSIADPLFRQEASKHCLERFWEMYLAVALVQRGCEVVRVGNEGPEFYVKHRQRRVWVEAVAPGPGVGPDRVEIQHDDDCHEVPTEKILLRFTNALAVKRKKYFEAIKKGIVSSDDSYLLAINSRGIPHPPFPNTMPSFVQAFLPFGPLTFAIDQRTGDIVKSIYQYRDAVPKVSGANISTKAFLDPDFGFCSAVLHSTVNYVAHPGELGADFCLLHNPSAIHNIDEAIFVWSRQLFLRDKELVEVTGIP